MIQCLSCKTQCPTTSAYCNQCVSPVLICPKCGTPGKGKFCSRDRTPLVQNHAQSAGDATPAAPSAPAVTPVAPAPKASAAQPQMQPAPYAATMRAPSAGPILANAATCDRPVALDSTGRLTRPERGQTCGSVCRFCLPVRKARAA